MSSVHYYLGDPTKRVVNRVSSDYILQQTRAKNTYPYGDIKFHLRYIADTYTSHSPSGSRASPGRGSPPAVPSSVRSGGSLRGIREASVGRTGSGGTVGSPPPTPGQAQTLSNTFDLSGSWEATGANGQREYFRLLAGNRLPPTEGNVSVTIEEARGLLPTLGGPRTGTSNPSIKMTLNRKNQKTGVKTKKTLDPQFHLNAKWPMTGCAQDTQLGYLHISPDTFEMQVEVESVEEKGTFAKTCTNHPIGQVSVDLTSQFIFKSGWDREVDLWLPLLDPVGDVDNRVAKQELKARQSQGNREPYGAVRLKFVYEQTRRSPPSSRGRDNWYVGYPSAESVRQFPKHTFEMSDAKVTSEAGGSVRWRTEFKATQVLGGVEGRIDWVAEVVDNARGELFLEKGKWQGNYRGAFTARQVEKA